MAVPVARLSHDGPRGTALPAYVSNGLVGLRVREVPLIAGMALVSGVAGEHPERRVEAALAVPYPLAGDIIINGVSLADQPWAVSNLRQDYDFATAELTSSFAFLAGEVRADVEIVTFTSRTSPALVLQEVAVRVDPACALSLRAAIDPASARGAIVRRLTGTPGEPEPVVNGSVLWETDGGLSRCGLALATHVLGCDADAEVSEWDARGPLDVTYSLHARKGQPIRLRQTVALLPSVLHARPDEEAVRRLARGCRLGFDALRAANREEWDRLWRSRIVVEGASEHHQALIDAAFYYLNSSVHRASPSSTSIFGLASWHDYHYYYGHVMWDIDAFCIPPLVLVQPDAAAALLDFRSRGTGPARTNARLASRDGLQFPWQAAPLTGQEASPGGGEAAAYEDHGSLHVARAFSLHADVTGDREFLRDQAWPILRGVADWLVSRVERTRRGFELKRAMGPAEVPVPPDNDAFTLMAAYEVLSRAVRAAGILGITPPASWGEVREHLYLPRRADGAIASHDGFRIGEDKGATPSPLAGFFPLDFPAGEDARRATFALFLPRWRDYVGSPMLPALYPVWAAMSGDRALAARLFDEAYAAYDHPRFHQCLEYRTDHPDSEVAAGPFFANLGGMLWGLMFGLTGLEADDGDPRTWPRRPVILPDGWSAIRIDRLWVRGREASLVASHGSERAELTFA